MPDFILKDTINLVEKNNIKSTLFITHETLLLEKLKNSKYFEIGIHPNINEGSTQMGVDDDEKIRILCSYSGSSQSNKFHLLGYNFNALNLLKNNGIEFDCSMLYYGTPYLLPTYHADSNLVLAPYFWEDGHSHSMKVKISFNMVDIESPGLKIFNFHPLDLYFNTFGIEHRYSIKNLSNHVSDLTEESTQHLLNEKIYGSRNYFLDLVNHIKTNNYSTYFCNDLNVEARKTILFDE